MITNQKRGIKNIKGVGCTMGQHAVLRLSLIVRKKCDHKVDDRTWRRLIKEAT